MTGVIATGYCKNITLVQQKVYIFSYLIYYTVYVVQSRYTSNKDKICTFQSHTYNLYALVAFRTLVKDKYYHDRIKILTAKKSIPPGRLKGRNETVLILFFFFLGSLLPANTALCRCNKTMVQGRL